MQGNREGRVRDEGGWSDEIDSVMPWRLQDQQKVQTQRTIGVESIMNVEDYESGAWCLRQEEERECKAAGRRTIKRYE